eukprot:2455988-Prymnesium_polylepis.1
MGWENHLKHGPHRTSKEKRSTHLQAHGALKHAQQIDGDRVQERQPNAPQRHVLRRGATIGARASAAGTRRPLVLAETRSAHQVDVSSGPLGLAQLCVRLLAWHQWQHGQHGERERIRHDKRIGHHVAESLPRWGCDRGRGESEAGGGRGGGGGGGGGGR